MSSFIISSCLVVTQLLKTRREVISSIQYFPYNTSSWENWYWNSSIRFQASIFGAPFRIGGIIEGTLQFYWRMPVGRGGKGKHFESPVIGYKMKKGLIELWVAVRLDYFVRRRNEDDTETRCTRYASFHCLYLFMSQILIEILKSWIDRNILLRDNHAASN